MFQESAAAEDALLGEIRASKIETDIDFFNQVFSTSARAKLSAFRALGIYGC
jgi:hypothetical protein